MMKPTKMLLMLVLVTMFGGVSTADARALTEREAREMATRFFVSRGVEANVYRQQVPVRSDRHAPGAAPTALYVYNNQVADRPCGFVVVSGDDRALPVLGYSESGNYDPATAPPALQAWLDFLAAEVSSLGDDSPVSYAPQRALGSTIRPILTCNWDQGAPYNSQLPMLTSINQRAVTGCVATAMAQVMYHYRWPDNSLAIPAYTTETLELQRPALPKTTFDWSSMKNNYSPTDAGTAADAVAKLMLYCGQAVRMDYEYEDGRPTSGAFNHDIPEVFQKYFNYAPSIRYAFRESYSKEVWERMLYSELMAGRPVIYGGSTMSGGGHSFVCDGYDNATGLFHINWGWSGSGNGYFALSALSSSVQGTGSSDGIEGYIAGQGMALGIQPNNMSVAAPTAMMVNYVYAPSAVFNRSKAGQDFTHVTIKGSFVNLTGATHQVNIGWALYQGNQRLWEVSNGRTYTIKSGFDETMVECQFDFGAAEANGAYRLVPVSRISPDGEWEVCEGSDVNYFNVQITNTTLTLTPYGIFGNASYKVNNLTCEGQMHPKQTIKMTANLTNQGTTMGDSLYLFVNNVRTTMEILDITPGTSGDVTFYYRAESTGDKTLKLSLNEDGSNPIYSTSISITDVPSAKLTMEHKVDGLQIKSGVRTLSGNEATVTTTVTNKKSSDYDENVTAELYRVLDGGRTLFVRNVTLPLKLAGKSSTTFKMVFSELVEGETYLIKYYYFSSGLLSSYEAEEASSVDAFLVSRKEGDVNGDNIKDIDDLNIIINVMVKKAIIDRWPWADVNGDGVVDVDDLNPVVNIMVGKGNPEAKTYKLPTGETFKMLPVKGGSFMMGAADGDADANNSEKPAHWVTLSDYCIGETEVTQELWKAVMGSNPSYFSSRKGYTENLQRPVECVSWEDCQTFITKLNQLTGQRFRLPTEAEWEYAARGRNSATSGKYPGSSDINAVAWYKTNALDVGTDSPDYGTHAVGTKSPNELGTYDMSGNVREWCADWNGSYGNNSQMNPAGPESGSERVNRGGSWGHAGKDCRVTARIGNTASTSVATLGLRLALGEPDAMQNEKELMLATVEDGVTYSIYKQVLDRDDVHVNPDGHPFYRSKLTLDVTRDGATKTYILDENIYLDVKERHHGGQRPCLLLNFKTGEIWVFCNSKDENSTQYYMEGRAYGAAMDVMSFHRELVFSQKNWGWSPYFVETASGQLEISHFSYKGYYAMTSTRSSSGQWNTVQGSYIKPDDFEARSLAAGQVLVIKDVIPEEPAGTTTYTVNGVTFKMVAVEGGTFTMGATEEQGSDVNFDERPEHEVTLSNYSIGQTEVTQALWVAVMGSNPSWFNGYAKDNTEIDFGVNLQRPVESMSWDACQEFISKLNAMTGKVFRLPTEAEWEYAARGGKQSNGFKYAGSNTLDEVAWYDANASYYVGIDSPDYGTHTVGTKSPNELGLYDMSGNVWEWCQDWYSKYAYLNSDSVDPKGPSRGTYHVERGGSWVDEAKFCRVSCRSSALGGGRQSLGLRLAM